MADHCLFYLYIPQLSIEVEVFVTGVMRQREVDSAEISNALKLALTNVIN
jgi:hypothetical protein